MNKNKGNLEHSVLRERSVQSGRPADRKWVSACRGLGEGEGRVLMGMEFIWGEQRMF